MENKNEIVLFKHDEFGEVRTLVIDGEPWFVAKDITDILKYSNSRKAITDHVDIEDKGVTKCYTLGGMQDLTIINESGLYSLVLSSKMPEAKKFRRWVTSEILPSLRKHGAYFTPQALYESLCDPKNLIEILQALADEQKRNTDLSIENAYL